MDIEKLKKVNQLATTLRQQGLAVGRDDAARLSADMNLGMQDNDLSFIMQPKTKIIIEDDDEKTLENEEVVDENLERKEKMDEKKYMDVLQNFADQFCAEINSLNEKIAEQEKIISELCVYHHNMQQEKEKMASNSQNFQNAPLHDAQQSATIQQSMERQETIQVKEQPRANAPRSGTYDSNDVSIEQFFYCGNK